MSGKGQAAPLVFSGIRHNEDFRMLWQERPVCKVLSASGTRAKGHVELHPLLSSLAAFADLFFRASGHIRGGSLIGTPDTALPHATLSSQNKPADAVQQATLSFPSSSLSKTTYTGEPCVAGFVFHLCNPASHRRGEYLLKSQHYLILLGIQLRSSQSTSYQLNLGERYYLQVGADQGSTNPYVPLWNLHTSLLPTAFFVRQSTNELPPSWTTSRSQCAWTPLLLDSDRGAWQQKVSRSHAQTGPSC